MTFPYILSDVFRLMTIRSFICVSHKYSISVKNTVNHRAAPLMSNNKTKNTSAVYFLSLIHIYIYTHLSDEAFTNASLKVLSFATESRKKTQKKVVSIH